MPKNTALTAKWRFEKSPKSLFSSLKHTKKLLLLSIQDSPHCAGKYLQASIGGAIGVFDLLIVIADEVYWNNLKPESCTPEEEIALKTQAIALGSQYIEDNLECLLEAIAPHIEGFRIDDFIAAHIDMPTDSKLDAMNQLAIQYNLRFKIARWHELTTHSALTDTQSPQQQQQQQEEEEEEEESIKLEFSEKHAEIIALFESEPSLKTAIEHTANDFAIRHAHNGGADLWKVRSRDYLIEEHAFLGWVMPRLGYNFLAYPAEITDIFRATRDVFVTSLDTTEANKLSLRIAQPENLLIWVQIKFKNKKEKTHVNTMGLFKQPPTAICEHKSSEAELANTRAMKSALESVQVKIRLLLSQQCSDAKSDGPGLSEQINQYLAEINTVIEQGLGVKEYSSESIIFSPGAYSPPRLPGQEQLAEDDGRRISPHLFFSSTPPVWSSSKGDIVKPKPYK